VIVFATLLFGLGVADAAGTLVTTTARARALVSVVAGSLAIALGIWGTGLAWGWGVVLAALLVLWVTSMAEASRAHPWPIVGLVVVTIAALALSPLMPVAHGWLTDWYASLTFGGLAGVRFDTFALAVASLAFLVESANLIVRAVLTSSLPRGAKPEAVLKGGRILGPIERIFIFAMALTGQFLAISAIVAAKSILRFPEVSNDEKHDGRGSAAEYVLVGSFVSWGIALLLTALVANS
jgi:hypothetical protein